jgi:tetratricopeptide (TPR) repeat protein
MQAAFAPDQVKVSGRFNDYTRISDEADRKAHVFHFCPECGSQVFYTEPDEPDRIVVSVGSFADPTFPPPTESGYEHRRHPWVALPDSIERDPAVEAWAPVHPLYEAGRYAEAADRGREVLEAYPHPRVFFNVACCESLAGRTADAIEHLRQAIDMWEGCREMARQDSDFDPIRDEPAFAELIGR